MFESPLFPFGGGGGTREIDIYAIPIDIYLLNKSVIMSWLGKILIYCHRQKETL